MSFLSRLFLESVCPTCSKSLPKAKLDAHQRRHERGRAQYIRRPVTLDTIVGSTTIEMVFRRTSGGAWALVPIRLPRYIADSPGLPAAIERRLADLNDLPTFTRREISDANPAPAPDAPVA